MAVVKAAGIEAEKREQRQRTSRRWRPHRSLMRFLQDHFPEEWHGDEDKVGIERCRMRFMVRESNHRRGYFKVIPQACKRIPYCITCTEYKEWIRAKKRMNRFHCCTPGGEHPRFIQLNFAASVRDDHTGVGMEACQDIGEFGKAVWETLLEIYGDGIGAEFSYHDFGERGFAKRYPHYDITLNGWMLQDGTAVHTPRVELKGGSVEKVWASYIRALSKRWELDKGDKDHIRSGRATRFRPVTKGRKNYRKALKYQCRELVDLRKLDYDRAADKVYWFSYKHNVREPFDADDFVERMHEYNERLSVWKKGRRNMLHRRYGHMSDRKRNETQQIVGGVPVPHGKDCTCGRCESWGRVYSTYVKPDTDVGTLEGRF